MNTRVDQYVGDLVETLTEINQQWWPDHYHYVMIDHHGAAFIVSSQHPCDADIRNANAWCLHVAYPGGPTPRKPSPAYKEALTQHLFGRMMHHPFALAAVATRLAENA